MGLGFMVNRDGTVVAPGSAAQAAGPQQQQQQQQPAQQPSNSAHTGQNAPPAKKKKKNRRSKKQQGESFSKNKLADLLKKKEKELEEQMAKCAELEGKLKNAELGLGSEDSDMEQEENGSTGISNSSSLNNDSSNKEPAKTTPDPVFVRPKPVAVSPSKNKNCRNEILNPATPARNKDQGLPAVHGLNTPASKLATEVINCNIKTPANKPESTDSSNSDPLKENSQGPGKSTSQQSKVSNLSIAPISDSDSNKVQAPLQPCSHHQRSGFFKDINARYCSLSEKMKLDFDEFGCYKCPRCGEEVQYYQKGDTIPLLLIR